MKVRLTSGLANCDVKNEWAGFHGVFEAAGELSQLCMIHHAASQIPIEAVLKQEHPDWSPETVHREVVRRMSHGAV